MVVPGICDVQLLVKFLQHIRDTRIFNNQHPSMTGNPTRV